MGGVSEYQHSYVQGKLTESMNNPGNRRLFLRVQLNADREVTMSGRNQASHALGSLAASDGLLSVPEGTVLEQGAPVSVMMWPKLL